MSIKEKIINLLSKKSSLTFLDIKKEIQVEDINELYKAMKELQEDFEIWKTKNARYLLFKNTNYEVGKISINPRGIGYVKTGEKIIKIKQNNLNGAIHDDIVLIEVISKDSELGNVLEIVKSNDKLMTGTVIYKNGKLYIENDSSHYKNIIVHVPKYYNIKEDYKVLFKLGHEMTHRHFDAEIIKVLGHKNDPDIDMISIIERRSVPHQFSEELLNEVQSIPEVVSEEDIKGRTDFRSDMVFTIDGDDAKDLDDAVSLDKLDNGNYLLKVHIADVSHYVKEDSILDQEALNRGTSVYLVDRVIPMLHQKLSNGICSLNEGVDRLTLSFLIEIDENGEIINVDVKSGVINSNKRMTYKKVNQYLEEGVCPIGYEPYRKMLLEMQKLSTIIRNKRHKDGAIEFDSSEIKIIVDDKGNPVDLKHRERGIGEKIIEDFMIAANTAVTSYVYNMGIPFIFRVHGYPEAESLEKVEALIKELGYDVNYPLSEEEIHPSIIQKTLEDLSDKPEYFIISNKMLRSMKRAEYSSNPNCHFGLAILALNNLYYTHLTSPIRRYPDLANHRILKDVIVNEKYDINYFQELDEKLPMIAAQASITERRAQECEWEVEDMKIAKYMQNHIGEVYDARVTDITNQGVSIKINGMVKASIPASYLNKFKVSDNKLSYVESGNLHKIGEQIRVKICDIDEETSKILSCLLNSKIKPKIRQRKKEYDYGNSK